jgi:hypothetical protein
MAAGVAAAPATAQPADETCQQNPTATVCQAPTEDQPSGAQVANGSRDGHEPVDQNHPYGPAGAAPALPD